MNAPSDPAPGPGRVPGRHPPDRAPDLARDIARLDGTEKQRWFEDLMASLDSGSTTAEDLTDGDLELLREVFGERADDMADLLDQLRGDAGRSRG